MPADLPLFTRPLVVTCLATFFFYLSFYLILPVMPLYLAAMGGTSFQIGLIIGPAVGTPIATGAGFRTLFLVAGGMALTADRVALEERGKAMGTFYTAWELGIMTGSTGAGLLLEVTDFSLMLLASSFIPVVGALLAFRARSPLSRELHPDPSRGHQPEPGGLWRPGLPQTDCWFGLLIELAHKWAPLRSCGF